MEIRVLRPEEFYELRDLLDGVFSRSNGRVTDFSRLFPRLFAAPNSYTTASHIGAFEDGKLVGTAAMYPLDYVIGSQHIRLIGNGNVAVHEDYRNRGVMTQILHKINEVCDGSGDLGYLHGDPVRYGRVGYVGCGVEYLLTFRPEGHAEYLFCPMTPAEVPMQQARSEQRCDFIRRAPDDFILSLRSGSREAISVFRADGVPVGFLSLSRSGCAVEEFALDDGRETEVFQALARALHQPVCVRLSGYDVQTLARCRDYADVKIGQPALFRIINPEPLRRAARELGLPEDTLYAPYLT